MLNSNNLLNLTIVNSICNIWKQYPMKITNSIIPKPFTTLLLLYIAATTLNSQCMEQPQLNNLVTITNHHNDPNSRLHIFYLERHYCPQSKKNNNAGINTLLTTPRTFECSIEKKRNGSNLFIKDSRSKEEIVLLKNIPHQAHISILEKVNNAIIEFNGKEIGKLTYE